jgi:hypothetical protein
MFLLGVLATILSLLAAMLGLYLGTLVYHLLVMLFVRPTGTGFEATFRVYAYTSAMTLLEWIPLLRYLATLYGLYPVFGAYGRYTQRPPAGLRR